MNKNGPVSDFMISIYIDNLVSHGMLSDLISNRNDRMFLENLRIPSEFVIPFMQEENGSNIEYAFKNDQNQNYSVTVNGRQCSEKKVNSGDYFTFTNKVDNRTVKILLIDTTEIKIGYKKFKLENDTVIYIGRSRLNEISYDFSDFISRDKHAAIRIDGSGNAYLEDLKRSIGIYVNGQRTVSKQLSYGDEITMMGFSAVYMGRYIAVRNFHMESGLEEFTTFEMKNISENSKTEDYFVTTPRILKSLDSEEIEIDPPPNPFKEDKTPALLVLGPSVTMSLMMMVSLIMTITNSVNGGDIPAIIASGAMAVSMLLGSLMWPMILRNYQRKKVQAEEKHRKSRYQSYIEDIEKKLVSRKERSERILNNNLLPSPEVLCSVLDDERNRLRLWERSPEDEDFLDIRIGLGTRPFNIRIKTPKTGFQLYEDELRELPEKLADKYSTLNNVPLGLNIRDNKTIGIIGSASYVQQIVDEIILNIISLHSFQDTKLVLITPEKKGLKFEKYKNIPHIWSDDKQIRYYASDINEVHYLFNSIDNDIKQREEMRDPSEYLPHFVLVVTDPGLIEKEALLRYIYDPDNSVGITAIFAYGDIRKLPKSCKTIIQSDQDRSGYYVKNKNENRFIPFSMDAVRIEQINSFAAKLSSLPIRRDARSLGIADRITFLQMYKAGNISELDIEKRWENNNSAKSLAAPIGTIAGGDVFSLDIHEAYHGCHGLVAGTTGSGKSEFLQSYILSLAVNYSPKEIAFVLIDFKGGDMARPFMKKSFTPALPHLSATISNLSGNVLYRALVSLKAEIQARQRIFNEAAQILGIEKLDINSYQKYFKGGRLETPLPHLVIIIDEFAQLKSQLPEFLTELINIAQVGRSLGIHLILATQKPGGIVDPQILSNSRFKICLKVSDRQDSIDVINRPDSAMIRNPGRMNLQIGYDEIFETIQSGYSGADYIPTKSFVSEEDLTIHMTDNTANPIHSAKIDLSDCKVDKTQIEAIVSEIINLGNKKGLAAKPLWLEPLPEYLTLNTLDKVKKGLCTATIGLIDNVQRQSQDSFSIDFSKTGSIALYGASGSGKTTFLQTLVYSLVAEYSYSPEELNLYAIDFGGRNLGYLSELPHTGGVVFSDDEEELAELIVILQKIIEERKQLFAINNCGTFSDYMELKRNKIPSILVLLDNYGSLRDRFPDLADQLTDIISAGKTFGVYFVITGSTKNSIYYKVIDHISSFITLKMNDPNSYLDIFNVRPPITPEDVSGRGITMVDHNIVEFQTAIAFKKQTEAERLIEITNKYKELKNSWSGARPVLLGEKRDCADFISNEMNSDSVTFEKANSLEPLSQSEQNLVLGISKSGLLTYGINMQKDFKVCVCANDLDSLNRYFRNIANTILEIPNSKIAVLDEGNSGLADPAERYHYIDGSDEFSFFMENMRPILNDRIENPNGEYEKIFILIPDFHRFFDMITDEQADFMRKVFQYITNPKFNIYFICGLNVNDGKSNDSLYISLVVNSEGYVIGPHCYSDALSIIETLPVNSGGNNEDSYFCLNNKTAEIKW